MSEWWSEGLIKECSSDEMISIWISASELGWWVYNWSSTDDIIALKMGWMIHFSDVVNALWMSTLLMRWMVCLIRVIQWWSEWLMNEYSTYEKTICLWMNASLMGCFINEWCKKWFINALQIKKWIIYETVLQWYDWMVYERVLYW